MELVPTSPEGELSEMTPATRTGPRRMLFIDNIRWTMILLVLSMHATDTYSPFGNWYYTDRSQTTLTTALIFGSYQSVLQAFFMALLFLVAGFFAAPSYDRKGFARFVRDRCVRLGVPTVLYMMIIGPLTQYFLSHSWGTGSFARQWFLHLRDGKVLSETGPMWFAAVLLVFSLLYACFRAAAGFAVEFEGALPSGKVIGGFIASMACATFIVRIFIPEDVAVLNVHPGDLPQYILMFSAGIVAHRHRWLESLSTRSGMGLALGLLVPSLALFVILLAHGGAVRGDTSLYAGGLNFVSFGKSVWESLVCVGASLAIVVGYRRAFNRQGRLATLLSENAFAVYLFHPPAIIALAILLHEASVPPLLKAALLTVAAAFVTFSFAALVLRRIPLLRRIL
jgi:glucan biosynthesis protein C